MLIGRWIAPAVAQGFVRSAVTLAVLAQLVPLTTFAQALEVAPVVVTATRVAQPLTDVLADVSILDGEAIERSGAVSLADVLVQLPGVEMTRNGGPAATTNLYVRGGDTNHTAVLIDGIRIDTQSGSGGATWSSIPAANIERIEILRGPAAAVYGSDAVSGVIQVFTKEGEPGFVPTLGLGLGTMGTRSVSAGLRGGEQGLRYSLALGRDSSDGFNAKSNGNPDLDGYGRRTASVRLGWQVAPAHDVNVSLAHTDADAGYDSSLTANDQTAQRLNAAGLSWQARWSDAWRSKMGLTRSADHYATRPSVYVTDTTVSTYLWQNTFTYGAHEAQLTLERREDALTNASTTPASTERSQNGVALGYATRQGSELLQVHLRSDDDSTFGRRNSGSLAWGHVWSPQWRLNASVGTAFRAPTLFQRFSEYGSSTLKPETSLNRELAVHYAHKQDRFSAVVYRNAVDNLITYVAGATSCASTWGCYESINQATLQGVTLSAATRWAAVNWQASWDVQNPEDAHTGKRLARRAKQLVKLGADTRWKDWRWSAEVLLSGDRFDNAANTPAKRLPGYGVLNVGAQKALTAQTELVVKVDNLGNRAYETAQTFPNAGRLVVVGLKWTGQ